MKQKLAAGIVRLRLPLLIGLLVCAVLCVFTVGKTKINYDLNRYLSEDTMTKRAMRVMEEEFGSSEQLRIMFCDLDETQLQNCISALNARPEILLATHDPEQDVRQAEGKTWQLVQLTLNECDAAALVPELRAMFPELGDYCVGGTAASQLDVQKLVAEEIPRVMLISVASVLLMLLLTSHAWLEPLVILVILAVSILINMGTNFLFADVSFVTFAVCAILQLALSIDYAIMLLHCYNDLLDEGMDAARAMTEALTQCMMRICSSAMTTVAGLLSLLFMSFTIGFDIGMVLSKGILISMLCVFLGMPGLVLLLEKPLRKTKHRPLRLGSRAWAGLLVRGRIPIAALLIAAVLFGLWLNSQNRFGFTEVGTLKQSQTAQINRVFGESNPLVLLVPGGDSDEDYQRQRELTDRLQTLTLSDGQPMIREISAMVTTGAEALQYYTAEEAAELSGASLSEVQTFFRLNGFEEKVRADRLIQAASRTLLLLGNQQIAELSKALRTARAAFHGPHYARIILEPAFANDDEGFHDAMDEILAAAESVYGKEYYVTGYPMSVYDISDAFRGDLLRVNLITLLAILLIVTLSFRSLRLPLLLVFVIEGAIWITMGFSRLIGEPIFFISYLICLSIQMGATIDYGILLSDQYRSQRRTGLDPRAAMTEAIRRALPTILTSGVILITAGFLVGKMCSVYYISSIGLLVSRGALVSALLVLSLLPALLLLCDRWVVGKKAPSEEKTDSGNLHEPVL